MNYHGLEIFDEDTCYFLFGMESLISKCQSWLWRSNKNLSEKNLVSLQRFDNRTYWQCAKKTRDTILKIDKAIRYLGNCIDNFENMDEYMKNGVPLEEAAPFLNASDDIPYHLDSLISYLRILADCISFATPFFYKTNKSIANRSFRDHRKWFIKTEPKFDPLYTDILKNHSEWFVKLAGKNPKGIRDILFHRFGTYQLGLRKMQNGKNEIVVHQITSEGVKDPDLTFTLESIINGFFNYLDQTYKLFAPRIIDELHPHITDDLRKLSIIIKITNCGNRRTEYQLYPCFYGNKT